MKFRATYSLRNRQQLLSDIENIKITSKTKLMSFDITNLYTNVPVNLTLDIVKKFLQSTLVNNEYLEVSDIDNIATLIELVTSQNFFLFNNKKYLMQDGLPMGSALSGLLADFYIDYIEQIIFSKKYQLFTKDIIYYGRYVDDILIIHNSSSANTVALLNLFNNIDKVKFTCEKETNNTLNFLDLTITKDIPNKKLSFDIYRKPTSTDIIIPKTSHCHPNQKMSAFRYMLNRVLEVPLDNNNVSKELNTILKIGLNNGYTIADIQNVYNKLHKNNIIKRIYPHSSIKKNYITIKYEPTINKQLQNVLNQYNIAISNNNKHKIGKILCNNKPKVNIFQKSGIYKITCNNCDKFYVGQTGRDLGTRFKEHTKISRNDEFNYKNKNNISAMKRHLIETKHNCTENNIQLLHCLNKSRKMDILEEYQILIHKTAGPEKILNDYLDINRNHLFLDVIKLSPPPLPPP